MLSFTGLNGEIQQETSKFQQINVTPLANTANVLVSIALRQKYPLQIDRNSQYFKYFIFQSRELRMIKMCIPFKTSGTVRLLWSGLEEPT